MTPDQIEILHAEAARWRGTPFRARSCACGPRGGVDCVRYVAALLHAAGVIPAVGDFTRYRIDGGHHLSSSPLLDFLRGRAASADSPRVAACLEEQRKGEAVAPGDLIVYTEGRTEYHAGIVLTTEGDFTHVLIGYGVKESSLRDSTYADRLQAVFRPVATKEES